MDHLPFICLAAMSRSMVSCICSVFVQVAFLAPPRFMLHAKCQERSSVAHMCYIAFRTTAYVARLFHHMCHVSPNMCNACVVHVRPAIILRDARNYAIQVMEVMERGGEEDGCG